MKTIVYIAPIIFLLTACGVKPDTLPGPESAQDKPFPRTYPQENGADSGSSDFKDNPYE